MPVRLLRPGILDSEKVDLLDYPEEVFYRRLMSVVDDYGCYDARPAILKSHLYPLRTAKIREADISRWSATCAKAGLIVLYKVSGKPYLQLLGLGEPRAKNRKYPEAPANICAQMKTDVPPSTADSYSPAPSPYCALAFEEFWSAWPQHDRKVNRKACGKLWQDERLDAQAAVIMDGLSYWKRSQTWADEKGRFIPLPLTWLRQRRWENKPAPAAGNAADNGFETHYPDGKELKEMGMSDEEIAKLETM